MSVTVGRVLFNRYQIQKLLGQGGFGAVYRAFDTNLERTCAIKENLVASPDAERQFKREAKILASLSHPNLPHIQDYFVIPGEGQYLVMEYIEGENLEQMLERTGVPLLEVQALTWTSQVCEALEYLHSQSPPIIHRDVKPANIRITPSGKAMLVDFGIAKLLDLTSPTTSGARAVTPGYSAPEQYSGQGTTDARSDIYSLGATLYTLFTRQVPPDSIELVTHTAPPPRPVRQVNPQVSAGTSAATERAMQTDPAQRFASAVEFRLALSSAASSPQTLTMVQVAAATQTALAIGQPAAPVPVPPAEPPGNSASQRKWLLGGSALLVLLALCCLGILGGAGIASQLRQNQVSDKLNALHATQTVLALYLLPPTQTRLSQPSPESTAEPTLTPEPTGTATSTAGPEASATPSFTPEAQPTAAPILLTDWKMAYFVPVSSGCKVEDLPCFNAKAPGTGLGHGNLTGNYTDLIMTSRNELYIDPKWENPYLVFLQTGRTYSQKNNEKAAVFAKIGTRFDYLKSLEPSTTNRWSIHAIDLNKYKGEKISLKFEALWSEWTLQGIQIVPNFTSTDDIIPTP